MFILDILFPKHCFVCKRLGKYICDECKNNLYILDNDVCIYCDRSSYLGLTHPGCRRKYGIDGCTFLYKYNNYLKTIIKALKYRLVKDGFEELMSIVHYPLRTKLGSLITLLDISPTLSPIPLSSIRKNQRGFNQSEILCRYITGYLGLKNEEFLIRSKNTMTQAKLKTKKLRYRNLIGAFKLKKGVDVRGKIIIIVDDVLTSGSTVKEAVRVLKRKEALKVFVFALAKG